MNEEKPITEERLRIELERFRLKLESEALEKQRKRMRYFQIGFAILMAMTIYFLMLYTLLKIQLEK